MTKTQRTILVTAAITGLLTGVAVKAHAQGQAGAGFGKIVVADDSGKHDCQGKNSCKGQGGCKGSDNGCKGKNSCKGKGGCNTKGSCKSV
ncbi:MAG TPA: hypothetical protein VHG89_11205 [Verrucomicrobiae bacterium]|nr:hypothetical protein [Verrucomicrobiae bacterium]